MLARTRSGYWKALDTTPKHVHLISGGNSVGWLVHKVSRLLVPISDVSNPPMLAYEEHRCEQYLEVQPIAPIPAKGEAGLVKISDAQEMLSILLEAEALEEINQVKQGRKAREKLTESERFNV